MKNISLGLVILSLLIVSCTTESIDNTESINGKVSSKKSEKSVRLVQNLTPENPANIYDLAGKLHNDILDVYLTGNYQYNTIAQISQQVEAIAAENNDLVLLTVGTNLPNNLDVIQEIVDNPHAKLEEAIANSTMTNVAKGSLSSFMNDVVLWKNDEYGAIYQSIISYESSVMTNPQFNNEDKRIILTTSSIVRYSLYYSKGRKDEDWDSSVGNRVGGLSGAINNSSIAITRSLVTGIMINNLVPY
ncbi:hypothetical protein EKL97_13635 [Flavobacterium sp. LS1P28]|uniref:hypothetical protein n=1 Tax=Flavobacterium sp. LS1P28 TaxID=2497752 RepID=UPI000F81C177|nr:hypothetical protein [Flavobacterium sp. LS1P28]RTY78832.1 hypothetical protein EKL97_13635 [Flavobacterium sp. LS1P28]